MKVKRIFWIIVGMILVAAFSVTAQNTSDTTGKLSDVSKEKKGAAEIELLGGSKGNISFPHQKHQETLGDCEICHVDFPQTAGAIDKLKGEGKLEKKEIMNKHCVKCHREKQKAGEKTGPTSCSKCHQKN